MDGGAWRAAVHGSQRVGRDGATFGIIVTVIFHTYFEVIQLSLKKLSW